MKSLLDENSTNRPTADSILKSLKNLALSSKTASSSKFKERYRIIDKLRTGEFGAVFKVEDADDKTYYALKQVQQKKPGNTIHEIKMLQSMNHPRIVRYHSSWMEKSEQITISNDNTIFYYIQMELCNKDLKRVIQEDDLYEDSVRLRSLSRGILEGLNYLHKKMNVIHGNLDPSNIFIRDNQIKIGDFRHARNSLPSGKYYQTKKLIKQQQFTAYDAPEGKGKCQMSDIYSFGVILFEMCNRPVRDTKQALEVFSKNVFTPMVPTIKHDDYMRVYLKVINMNYGYERNKILFSILNESSLQIIRRLLNKDARKRASAAYLLKNIPDFYESSQESTGPSMSPSKW